MSQGGRPCCCWQMLKGDRNYSQSKISIQIEVEKRLPRFLTNTSSIYAFGL